MPGVCVIFEAAPPLKYAEDVRLYSPSDLTIWPDIEALMLNFTGMKSLHLWLNYHVVRHCSWTFLCRDDARELRLIMECVGPSDRVCLTVEEFVHQCVTLPHTRGGKPLELDLTKTDIPGAFGLRIIEMLENSGRDVTFRMTLRADAELALDESDYTVVVDGATKRYASKRSRIAVEVEGRLVTIQRTAEASQAEAFRQAERNH